MKPGTVLIYHSKGILPWLIRKFTKSYWNHAGIVGENTEEGHVIYEAQASGLVKSVYPAEKLAKRLWDAEIDLLYPRYKVTDVKKHCENYLGIPYGIGSLFKIGWGILTKKTPEKSDGIKKMICSEFVARVLYDATNKRLNFEREYNKDYDFITPDDIWKSDQLADIK